MITRPQGRERGGMTDIELFLQGETIREISLIRVPANGTIGDILRAARENGFALAGDDQTIIVQKENAEEVLALDLPLETAGITHRSRLHLHRCRFLEVTVHFNGRHIQQQFPPSTTIEQVKRWAVGKEGFQLHELDATEHVLQICSSQQRPDEDIHIGTLVQFPQRSLCFDFVPKQRVEG